jgi:hypothetical protein
MAEDHQHLTLVYLRRLDAKVDQVIKTQADHGRKLTALEVAIGNLASTEVSHYANVALRADSTDERLASIERRLELRDA